MKNPLQKLSMHKRMMLYFSVPLILVQILLCFLCYPQVVRHYREKTDYSMEQSVSQAISFTESYLRNMTYLANMVEDNGVIQNTLSADGFGEERPYMEQWLEYYELNKEFNSYEISNSVYRFCLYVPDEVMYAGNQYYFDGVSRLKERSDYVDLRYALNRGEDYVAISRERDGVDQQDTSQMVTLYHRIASKKEKEEELGICSISVSVKCFQDIMKNANITSEGLVYLMSENGRMITSSNSSILQKMQKKGILLNYGAELFMEKKKEGQKEYYITRQNVDGASWQMILMIPKSEYEDQYRSLWLSAALMLGSMIAVIVLMSYLLSGYYVGRLKKLNAEMTGLESGNLNANLPITTEEDEIEKIYHNLKDVAHLPYTQDCMVISNTSKNPERAMALWDLITNDQEVYDAFYYGIEGTSYELNDEGQFKVLDTDNYGTSAMWSARSDALNRQAIGTPDDYKTNIDEFESHIVSGQGNEKFTGFVLDTSSFETQLAACNNVQQQYWWPLELGYTDAESGLADYQSQMEAAGIETMKEAAQKQLDAYVASLK